VAVDPAVARAVENAHRTEWAFVLAATVRVTADLDLAEECAQTAFAKALVAWSPDDLPIRPGAWLTTTARHLALDQLRRETVLRRHLPLLVEDETAPPFVWGRAHEIEDDRLRLIFTCCHPSLAISTQVALTLRFVCGLTTTEVARAFLVSESTMAARLTRAKKKITQARIPYRTPTLEELADRITAVLQVVHLVFTTGHASPGGEELVRDDLVDQGLLLARMLRDLLPNDAGVAGLLALLVLTDARRTSRLVDGRLVLLADQDRSVWDRAAIAEGTCLVESALSGSPPSVYALMAAIASIHDNSPSWEATDFTAIVGHYDALMRAWPSPVVALNRAVAVGFAEGPEAGLRALEPLAIEPLLASYPYFPAARADFCRQVGDVRSARLFYEEALMLTANEVERAHLERQLAELGD
jgi:RNA polymerase sigma-70 factor (ECF subfamily)